MSEDAPSYEGEGSYPKQPSSPEHRALAERHLAALQKIERLERQRGALLADIAAWLRERRGFFASDVAADHCAQLVESGEWAKP